jgi:hypothetical protein
MEYDDETYEGTLEDNYDNDDESYSSDTESVSNSQDGSPAVMAQFYDLNRQQKIIEQKWKGKSYDFKGQLKWTGSPIGSDSFVDRIMTSIKSIMSQHNSISTLTSEKTNNILWENDKAMAIACLNSPGFNEDAWDLFCEEYDHMNELFMGHVTNSHGIKAAQALQAGVVSETVQQNQTKSSFLDIGLEVLRGGLKK